MRKVLLFLIITILTVNLGFAIEIKKQEYNASHYRVIESFYLIVNGELSLNLSDYYYSLNEGSYKRFSSVVHDQLDTKLKILDLDLKPGKNSLKVLYNNEAPAVVYIYFLQPVLKITSVEQNGQQLEMLNESYILDSQNPVNIGYEYDFPENTYGPLWGPAVITSANYYFGTWNKTSEDIISVDEFNYGLNEFLIQPVNNKNETYLTERLTFFYSDFQLPGSVWKKDTLIKLTGYPEGGYFTGEGVLGNSNSFNPSITSGGNQAVVYHYPFGDAEITIERTIKVFSYNFSVSGELSVCRNAADVMYQIENFNPDFEYVWNIEGGRFLNPDENSSTNSVRWDDNPPGSFGKINVVAIHKNSGAEFNAGITVYLKNSVAYDKANFFFGDEDKRLLICEKTDVFKYWWSKDGSANVETVTPYFYFDGPGNHYDLTLVTEEGCETIISLSANDLNKSGGMDKHQAGNSAQAKIDLDQKIVMLYPNPVKDKLIIQTGLSGKQQIVRIYDSNSRCLIEEIIEIGKTQKTLNISQIPSGTYILKVNEGNKMVSQQFIKMQ